MEIIGFRANGYKAIAVLRDEDSEGDDSAELKKLAEFIRKLS